MNPHRPSAESWLAGEWMAVFQNLLESSTGGGAKLALEAPAGGSTLDATSQEIGQQQGALLWFQQIFRLPGSPALWIGAPEELWQHLASRISGAATGEASQARETYLGILRQSISELLARASRRWGREVGDGGGREDAGPPPAGEFYPVVVSYSDTPLAPFRLAVTGEFPELPAAAHGSAALVAPSVTEPPSKTFDLLMDVELPVSVSFGHVALPLKDVLKLAAGSVIELDRTIDEPVEVIVNNCVVARGEVVVVEGNYGVRIQQIMSRQQRLESMP